MGFASGSEDLRSRLEELLAGVQLHDTVLVAELQARVVGVVVLHVMRVLHRPAPVGRINTFVVTERERERERGRGAGTALFDAAERWLIGRGCGLLEVTSNRRLAQAHAFYERRGYAITSHRFAKPVTA